MTLDRTRDGIGSIATWFMMGLMALIRAPGQGWRIIRRQAGGTWRNTKALYNWFAFDRILPPGVVGLIQFFIQTVPVALGIRGADSKRQFGSATVLIFLAFLSSVLTYGLTLFVVVFFGIFWLISLFRLVPAFNDGWMDVTGRLPIKRDYDIWRWSRD